MVFSAVDQLYESNVLPENKDKNNKILNDRIKELKLVHLYRKYEKPFSVKEYCEEKSMIKSTEKRKYQVFVSSTYEDLVEERKEVTQALLENNCIPAGMELFPASNKKQWDIIKTVIDESDYYLLIIAGRYGKCGIDDYGNTVSYTEMEYDYAIQSGKPIIVFIHSEPHLLPLMKSEETKLGKQRLNKFIKKASTGREVAFWTNKDNLKSKVIIAILAMIRDYPTGGWVKVVEESSEDSSENIGDIFKEKLNEIYPLLIEYREAIRKLNSIRVNETTETIQHVLQDLYYLTERYRYSEFEEVKNACEIIDKWNNFTVYFNAFANASNRMSDEAQNNARKAEELFSAIVDLVVKSL